MTEKSALRLILLEDDPGDAALVQELLEQEHFVCAVTRAQTRAEFVAALENGSVDLILADYRLPSFDGISALTLAQSARPELPFIFVSGTLGEEVAIEALKIGATDYVLKTRLSRLVPSVQRALREAGEKAERKKAEEALQRAQAELAHVNRVATMGQITASIAHEVTQPIAAVITNAQAALGWLGAQPPDLEEVRQSLDHIVEDGKRAGNVLGRIRALVKKAPPRKARFDLNDAVRDVMVLTRSEVLRHSVALRTQLAAGLPPVEGDRVQLQQVVLNLIMNAVEAMSGSADGPRELQIGTGPEAAGGVLVTVEDSGPGLDPAIADRVFEAFYTTKPDGMGMGLAICRAIVEAHGGRMWASENKPRGAVFQFTLPPQPDESAPAARSGRVPAA